MTNKYLAKIAGIGVQPPPRVNRFLAGIKRRAEITPAKLSRPLTPGTTDLSSNTLNPPLSKIAELREELKARPGSVVYRKWDPSERLRRLRERRGETEEQFEAVIHRALHAMRKHK
jgi:dephospho-CoA kinase